MKRNYIKFLLLFIAIPALVLCTTRNKEQETDRIVYDSYKGLVLCGYQGWFTTPTDGANMGWGHYGTRKGLFEPGQCTIDFWPEMDEYEIQYETPFKLADGSAATIYSPHDASSVDLHFKWMKEAGIDGVFMQRFVNNARPSNPNKAHFDKVFDNAMKAAQKYNRTVCLMYDLSGLRYRDGEDDISMLLNDWKEISEKYGVYERDKNYDCYLHHNGKPLLAIWGIGFPDRPYPLEVPEKMVKSFKEAGVSLHLGVPTYWRTLTRDTRPDSLLHDIIRMGDIVHPWTPGRYNNKESYDRYKPNIAEDIAWCKENGLDFAAGVFPGFSWYNNAIEEFPGRNNPLDATPRREGRFLWMQLEGAVNSGAEMIYVCMFDEIDEGTAIFKLTSNPPAGESPFVARESTVPSDHYMWLCGRAGDALKKKTGLPVEMPRKNLSNSSGGAN
ncbi:MAG: xylosidase [Tannerella sp.]|jgi:hypothetical protein|nr:xylosidase [Tannerella sp.]